MVLGASIVLKKGNINCCVTTKLMQRLFLGRKWIFRSCSAPWSIVAQAFAAASRRVGLSSPVFIRCSSRSWSTSRSLRAHAHCILHSAYIARSLGPDWLELQQNLTFHEYLLLIGQRCRFDASVNLNLITSPKCLTQFNNMTSTVSILMPSCSVWDLELSVRLGIGKRMACWWRISSNW